MRALRTIPEAHLKTFQVIVKIRNNRLIKLREQLGLSGPQVAEKMGVSYGVYIQLESLTASPMSARNEWRDVARRVAEFHGVDLEYLFPDAVLAVKQAIARREVEIEEIAPLLSGGADEMVSLADGYDRQELAEKIAELLGELTQRDREIVSLIYGLGDDKDHTYE